MKYREKTTANNVAYTSDVPNTPLRFLGYVSKPHKMFAVGTVVSVTIAQILSSLNPFVMKQMVDGFVELENFEEQVELLAFWGVVYVILLATSFVFWRASGFIGMEWITRLYNTAFVSLYEYISYHSNQYFSDRFAGSLASKISNASDGAVRLIERTAWGWYPEVITLLVGFILLFTVDPYISIGFTLVVALMIYANIRLSRKRRPLVVDNALALSKLRGEGVDYLTNISASRQYARHLHEIDRLSESALDMRTKDVRQWRLSEWINAINNAASVLLIVGILVYVYMLFSAGQITIGEVLLTIGILGQLKRVINFLGNMLNGFTRIHGEMEEGLGMVLLPYDVEDAAGAEKLEVQQGMIAWNKVSFKFDDTPVFRNFDLRISPGQRVGLVGASGAGKTTFMSLLLRQHDIDSGTIEIDMQDISKVTQDSLRKSVAVVPQEPLLFHRTIKENIAYGKLGATTKEIEDVAKKARVHEFVSKLPQGYRTLVGERGVKLSGGQKQRVAIARAMLKDAPILILDEATSALDSESEVAIQKALHKLMEGKTVVAIAHRLSTLREMDRIIVLDKGKIIEDGTHDELSKAAGQYQKLWEHQAGGFLQD